MGRFVCVVSFVSFVSFVFVSFVFVLDVCGWMMLVLLLEEWIVCLMDEVFVCFCVGGCFFLWCC